MSVVLSGDTISYLMGLGLSAEQVKGVMDRVQRDAAMFSPPATSSGVNEERERLRNESTYPERKRAKDRERQRRLRDEARQSRDIAATSRDIDGDPPATLGDASRDDRDSRRDTSCAHVRDNLPKLVTTGLVGVGGVGAREAPDDWPTGSGPHLGKLLIEAAASPWLDPAKSPDLTTTLGRLAAWKRDGASWEHDVLPVVTGLCANRRSRIASWKFFDAAIARSIADNRAALEIPEAGQPRATGPPGLTARIADERAESERRAFEMMDAKRGRTN